MYTLPIDGADPHIINRYYKIKEQASYDENGCLIPRQKPNSGGYVQVKVSPEKYDNTKVMVHRLAWAVEIIKGMLDSDMEIDHFYPDCKSNACFELSHIQLVPHRINVMRGKIGRGERKEYNRRPDIDRDALSKRNETIRTLKAKGFTLQEIGAKFGLTRERIRQIVKKA